MIGIVAGEGMLPLIAKTQLDFEKKPYFILGFHGCKYDFLSPNIIIPLTSFSNLIKILKENNIKEVILCGKIKIETIKDLKLDSLKIIYEYLKILLLKKNCGDNLLLKTAIKIFNDYKISVLKIQDICPNLLVKKSDILNQKESKFLKDAKLGFEILDYISKIDLSQALVISNGRLLGIEGVDGTDQLISRYAYHDGNKILVKGSKKNQDMRVDVATIGTETIKKLYENKYKAIALKDMQTFIIEKEEVFTLSRELGIEIIIL